MNQAQFNKDVWHREAETIARRNGIRTRRWGMRVTVYNDPVAANNGDYVLSYNLANTNRQSNNNWLKVSDIGNTWGSSGGTLTDAESGLHLNGTIVRLGGDLLGSIAIGGGAGNYGIELGTIANPLSDLSVISNAGLNLSGALTANSPGGIHLLSSGQIDLNTDEGSNLVIGGGTGFTLTNPVGFTMNGAGIINIGTTTPAAEINVVAENQQTFQAVTGSIQITGGDQVNISSTNGINLSDNSSVSFNVGADEVLSLGANTFVVGINSGASQLIVNSQEVHITGVPLELAGLSADPTGSSGRMYLNTTTDKFRVYEQGQWFDMLSNDIAGNAVAANVVNPTVAEDGYVIAWNDGLAQYELVPPGGSSFTFENGLTDTTGTVRLGGSLTQNTNITGGGSFDLSLGINGNRLNAFQVWSDAGVLITNNTAVSGNATLTLNTGQSILSSDAFNVLQHAQANVSTQVAVSVLKRQSDLNLTGPYARFINEAGNTTAGFGGSMEYYLSNGSSNEVAAMIDDVAWTVTTNTAEYADYSKQLKINGAMTDVMTITTSSTAPNIFVTLFGLLILPNLPTSSAGLGAGSVWNNSGVLNIV